METLQKETQLCKKTQEKENLSLEGNVPVENRIEGDGNNTPTQRRLGQDIGIIGAREETLGTTRSQTQEMSSPRNESMERQILQWKAGSKKPA